MTKVEFFKLQAKNLVKDFNSRVFNEDEGFYDYNPRFFHDIEDIIDSFDIDEEEPLALMKAQHIIARLAGFYKWTDLIKASESLLELGVLLLINREAYQEKQGYLSNMVESFIVSDWKEYETKYLKGADDQTKLEVFKKVFLGEENRKSVKKAKIKLDFSEDDNAQDMLKKIMSRKNLDPERAILSSITQKMCIRIMETGWANIALPLWGHGNPDVEKEKLENPIIEIKPNKDKTYLIKTVMEFEKVPFKTAVLYFMIFTLESLGYHI